MFGKGVYFADMVTKSANYCFANKKSNVGLLLLCEVALGNINEKLESDYNADNLPKGKHSTKGLGKTAPDLSSYIKHDNYYIPIGKAVSTNIKVEFFIFLILRITERSIIV